MKKRRFSMPAKIVDLLWNDNEFYDEVLKIKKVSSSSNFPKNDQWADDKGFHLEFALAGYGGDDIRVTVKGDVLTVCSEGMADEVLTPQPPKESDDAFESYTKDAKPKAHRGFIVRGIARRAFLVRYLISDEYDLSGLEAAMENGLLHIFIPNAEVVEEKSIVIKMRER